MSETGGRSQLSGLAAVFIVLALLTIGTTLLKHVPDAALGGILLFVALRIIRLRQIAMIWRQSKAEFLLIVATAALIIVLPIQQGAGLAISLSLLHGIWSVTRARLVVFERVPGTTIWWPANPHMTGERMPGVAVVGLQAPLSFLNAPGFRADVLNVLQSPAAKPRLLVLEASGVVEIDFTAAQHCFSTHEVDIFLGEQYLVTVHDDFSRSLAHLREVCPRNDFVLAEGPAALYGGTLDAQPRDGGGIVVRATLPVGTTR